MKLKALWSVLLLTPFLLSCWETTCKVSGVVPGAADGDSVFIVQILNNQIVPIDTVSISGGKFSTTLSLPEDESIAAMYPEGQNFVKFFPEKGKVSLVISESSIARGTRLNNIMADYIGREKQLDEKFDELDGQLSAEGLSPERRQEILNSLEQTENEYYQMTQQFCQDNITNPIGIELLKQNYYSFDGEALYAMVQDIPEKYRSDSRVQRIIAAAEARHQTAPGVRFADFSAQTPDGKTVSLSDYAGKGNYVLVDFWASWCGPCCEEMPNLVRLYKEYAAKGFEIVGVSLDRELEAWKQGISRLGITWPQMSDLKYWQAEAAGIYGVSSIPHTVLIGPDGIIIERDLRGVALASKLAELMK